MTTTAEVLPARCIICGDLSDDRPLGQTPEFWVRGIDGHYYCDGHTDLAPGLPEGCYLHKDRVWTVIAASKEDEDGNEIADPEPMGSRERERVWRFRDEALANAWAAEIGAEKATRIADCPRHINGWVVWLCEATEDWHEPIEVER